MFIELTDILRCPETHEEQFLVLIPDQMAQRSVRAGRLGCPICHREYPIVQGVVDFGTDEPAGAGAVPLIGAEALSAFLGLSGPGGYVGLAGASSRLVATLIDALPSVHFVSINPPVDSTELAMVSLVRSSIIPIKKRSLRGVVLLQPFASAVRWLNEAERVLLPGLRVVGEGTYPGHSALELLASAGGWWVAQKQ